MYLDVLDLPNHIKGTLCHHQTIGLFKPITIKALHLGHLNSQDHQIRMEGLVGGLDRRIITKDIPVLKSILFKGKKHA